MLLAELHRKISRPFACSACGETVAPEAAIAIEDALTSHVFGTLRYLPTQVAVGPLLAAAGISIRFDEEFDIKAWPFGSVPVIGIGTAVISSLGVEPDVELCDGRGVVCVEVKLGSRLGADPLQLPKEVLWTIARAGKREWALLCVTADHAPPRIRSFVADGGRIGLGQPTSIEEAVASYFEAARSIAPDGPWPDPTEVRSRIAWMSWAQVARVLTLGRANAGNEPWVRRACEDLVALLAVRGLVTPTFHGFRCGPPLPSGALLQIWRAPRPPVFLWGRLKGERLNRQSWLAKPNPATVERNLWRRIQTVSIEGAQRIWRRRESP